MPPDRPAIAGIVLAGGKSSRMEQNKALMIFRGKPLLEHMMDILRQAGCSDVHISGDVPGYTAISDSAPHAGPAPAIIDLLHRFRNRYERLLFVPVDMPLLHVQALQNLLMQNGNVFYKNYPLPVCLRTGGYAAARSVRELAAGAGAETLDLSPEWDHGMANVNTKKEWENLAS